MKRVVIKLWVFIIFALALEIVINAASACIETYAAIHQFANSLDASFWIQAISTAKNYGGGVLIVLAILIFHKDIQNIFIKFKENKGEKEKVD